LALFDGAFVARAGPTGRRVLVDGRFAERTSDWLSPDGLLLGWRTYEAFARDWPRITDPNSRRGRALTG
jgi:hypothetical protein